MLTTSSSGKIRLLPEDVVSRIAAGEVVERPAAVVKELIENSVDAQSRTITVEIKDGGLASIRVTDDGEGMNRADAPQAFERHATSKLRSDQDLWSIRTMGFRGEALPSIASVSNVRLVT
ncbi:MAG: mismatch repair protein MutL, partial [Nitrospirota bacterium]